MQILYIKPLNAVTPFIIHPITWKEKLLEMPCRKLHNYSPPPAPPPHPLFSRSLPHPTHHTLAPYSPPSHLGRRTRSFAVVLDPCPCSARLGPRRHCSGPPSCTLADLCSSTEGYCRRQRCRHCCCRRQTRPPENPLPYAAARHN